MSELEPIERSMSVETNPGKPNEAFQEFGDSETVLKTKGIMNEQSSAESLELVRDELAKMAVHEILGQLENLLPRGFTVGWKNPTVDQIGQTDVPVLTVRDHLGKVIDGGVLVKLVGKDLFQALVAKAEMAAQQVMDANVTQGADFSRRIKRAALISAFSFALAACSGGGGGSGDAGNGGGNPTPSPSPSATASPSPSPSPSASPSPSPSPSPSASPSPSPSPLPSYVYSFDGEEAGMNPGLPGLPCADGGTVILPDLLKNVVYVIDAKTRILLRTLTGTGLGGAQEAWNTPNAAASGTDPITGKAYVFVTERGGRIIQFGAGMVNPTIKGNEAPNRIEAIGANGSKVEVLEDVAGTGTQQVKNITTNQTWNDGWANASDLAVGPDGRTYVTDTNNNRVTVDTDGSGVITISGLNQPTGLAVSSDRIVVAEAGAHDLAVLDLTGNRRNTLGNQGNGPGQFQLPDGVAIVNGETPQDIVGADDQLKKMDDFDNQ